MLCEECQKNEATVSITVTVGDEVKTRRLCQDCMSKMELSLTEGDIQGFLSAILSVLSAPDADTLTCGGCGLTYADFERTGRLGCAQCYHDFAERLDPLLQRIHGRTRHVGRRPDGAEDYDGEETAGSDGKETTGSGIKSGETDKGDERGDDGAGIENRNVEKSERHDSISAPDSEAYERERRIAELRQKMDEAVASESFEDAAKYRDEIRALTDASGAQA